MQVIFGIVILSCSCKQIPSVTDSKDHAVADIFTQKFQLKNLENGQT